MFIALLSVLALSGGAFAKNGILPLKNYSTKITPTEFVEGGGQLMYYGGPVISNVKTVVVFWGPNTNPEFKQKAAAFYTSLANSTFMDLASQYHTFIKAVNGQDGTKQKIGRGTYLGSQTIIPFNAKTKITDEEIQEEIGKQIQAGKLPVPDNDTLYMIHFPAGMSMSIAGMGSCSAFCAYHNFYGSPSAPHFYYGVMPECAMCGNSFDYRTYVSSHEFMEAVTDPFPTPGDKPAYPQAWNTTTGEEISDVCQHRTKLVAPNATYAVTSNWDNSKKACANDTWKADN